ncbi:hypothetical protein FDI23_gp035 [Serratia phage CHI14]|uniref:Uncharacterized protein n=2 Tax=Winklervirus chi14 TaxID=2560752 RepID=A0A1Z1LY54_9CAUD|nr:hypothetical protein FDI23_gp035 [Serratia phage CHI14]ARW57458.1 hypothetical protein [Serratia phage CHI14]ARW57733.1 hypothetical protein [Serratia phage CBH8]
MWPTKSIRLQNSVVIIVTTCDLFMKGHVALMDSIVGGMAFVRSVINITKYVNPLQ